MARSRRTQPPMPSRCRRRPSRSWPALTSFFGIPPLTLAGWMAGAVGAILLVLLLFAGVNRILLRMALRNIPRRRAQSVLILFGLMLATLIITASLAIGDTSSYSLQAIEVRQIGGVDAAFTRPGPSTVAGAGTSNSNFFTADHLGAKPGDTLQLYVEGHPVTATVRGILTTEVNPSIANHGPIVNSVLMAIDQVQALISRPGAVNIVFVHIHGPGGVADLGPQGATGDEVTRHMRGAFTDQQSADELKAYLSTPAIKAQVAKVRDDASFLDPDRQLADRLLVELNKPTTTGEFKSMVAD